MNQIERYQIINKIISTLEECISGVMMEPKDEVISNGNAAVCFIDENGVVYGKMFGNNRPRTRHSYKIAWTKASQVWLTGVRTGEYERMVFTGEVPENANGIENPDLIGWVGGQPIELKDGLKLSVGFSGFRGETDIEIVLQACRNLNLI